MNLNNTKKQRKQLSNLPQTSLYKKIKKNCKKLASTVHKKQTPIFTISLSLNLKEEHSRKQERKLRSSSNKFSLSNVFRMCFSTLKSHQKTLNPYPLSFLKVTSFSNISNYSKYAPFISWREEMPHKLHQQFHNISNENARQPS
ncbi:unnamed protein product [Trifolium pratense]|uniref:Uncharacterized protein n=1 Tax=Trifolium pratense TaxID=57577 RepID=A0ACB0M9D3_TRIPR|nr:unnamed protein product [Trifolium pratense]